MKIRHTDGREHHATDVFSLENLFESNKMASYQISETKDSYPYLLVGINNQVAVIYYFPQDENHPGFVSMSGEVICELDKAGTTEFLLFDRHNPELIDNQFLVSISYAARMAFNFMEKGTIETEANWYEF